MRGARGAADGLGAGRCRGRCWRVFAPPPRVHRRAGRRPRRQLSRRRHGCGQRGRRRARRSRLRINNRQQEGSSATLRVDARQAWLPLLLHPAPRHALFLGLGTGITASSAAEDPALQVDAVELLPEVIAASAHFTSFSDGAPNPRLHLIAADARRYVRASDRALRRHRRPTTFTRRAAARARCTPWSISRQCAGGSQRDGVFCQWLPLHQLDLDTLRSIVQSFLQVFPHGWALLASNSLETPVLGLVGRATAAASTSTRFARALAAVALPQDCVTSGIEDEFALLGSFVAGPACTAALRGRRRAQHRRSPGGGVPRAAYHLRARFPAARPPDRAAARTVRSSPPN